MDMGAIPLETLIYIVLILTTFFGGGGRGGGVWGTQVSMTVVHNFFLAEFLFVEMQRTIIFNPLFKQDCTKLNGVCCLL